MVRITIAGDRVQFDVQGWDKLWAFKSQLEIPLEHITAVRADPEPARGWWHGLRLPEHYKRLIVEVEHPGMAVSMIQAALAGRMSS